MVPRLQLWTKSVTALIKLSTVIWEDKFPNRLLERVLGFIQRVMDRQMVKFTAHRSQASCLDVCCGGVSC